MLAAENISHLVLGIWLWGSGSLPSPLVAFKKWQTISKEFKIT
jgi:hypothetical protein